MAKRMGGNELACSGKRRRCLLHSRYPVCGIEYCNIDVEIFSFFSLFTLFLPPSLFLFLGRYYLLWLDTQHDMCPFSFGPTI